MAKMTTDELLGVFEEMTVLELKEFLDAFEQHFDVTAAAPMAMAAMPAAGGAEEEEEVEQTEFDVVLTAIGDAKIAVIKEVRAITKLGLRESKELVDAFPKAILEGVDAAAADAAKKQLEGAGASAEIR
ncbi:MAG: 50S ribosomal protein L7/L12 [Acidimicrobiia bacterium]|nr:50S ribosomal protein L7/L12 [bacterium]MXW69574.1 50S ribosomal protein L7/L12 [Acidimicrobiia bacterium]MDE0674559.1 50S ribosomal protein L7/L12 [bacterium]MXX01543.1 50S ribosomal protein L7/L12 [Acidimicrobiia bacterium]MXX46261.1 50S ribosomal protein L7/L12 [Acidimicrobiia bacterium]